MHSVDMCEFATNIMLYQKDIKLLFHQPANTKMLNLKKLKSNEMEIQKLVDI